MREEVSILGVAYPRQEDLKNKCRLLLYANDEVVRDPSDVAFLSSLLERHPNAKVKIGVGISQFRRVWTGKGTKAFVLDRLDGTSDNFSFYKCIKGKPMSLQQSLERALRTVVKQDIKLWKDEQFTQGNNRCSVSGVEISRGDADVDHEYPLTFQKIVSDWQRQANIQLSDTMFITGLDHQFEPKLADSTIEDSFRGYHRDVAVLRLLSRPVHRGLKKPRKEHHVH